MSRQVLQTSSPMLNSPGVTPITPPILETFEQLPDSDTVTETSIHCDQVEPMQQHQHMEEVNCNYYYNISYTKCNMLTASLQCILHVTIFHY